METHVGCPRTETEKMFLDEFRWPIGWPHENNIEDHPVFLEVIRRAFANSYGFKTIEEVQKRLLAQDQYAAELELKLRSMRRQLDIQERTYAPLGRLMG